MARLSMTIQLSLLKLNERYRVNDSCSMGKSDQEGPYDAGERGRQRK
jgi:hypothetical protein